MRGVERRIDAGLDPVVGSVASVFMSRWDVAVARQGARRSCGTGSRSRSGSKTYQAYRELMDSDRWQRLANAGARMQRLLWASTSTKDPEAPDTLYVHRLGAPFTVNTMPEATLDAFYDHGHVGTPMPTDGGDADATLAAHRGGRRRRRRARRQAPDRRRRRASSTPGTTCMAHIDAQSAALAA